MDSSTSDTAHTTATFLVELARQTREHAPGLSPADEIAALDHTYRLAAFRGHPQPTREDLLDGIRSAFGKGVLDGEGQSHQTFPCTAHMACCWCIAERTTPPAPSLSHEKSRCNGKSGYTVSYGAIALGW